MNKRRRREGRDLAFRLIFGLDVGGGALDDALDALRQSNEPSSEVWEFGSSLGRGAWERREEADAVIRRFATGWSLERMANADRNLLRLAIYEIVHRDDIPQGVSINEAVELAKTYSTIESAKFVNGILGNYVREREQQSARAETLEVA